MTRLWRLRLRDGSTRGPWHGSRRVARDAALRAGGWRRLPPGAVLEDTAPRVQPGTTGVLDRPFVPRAELLRAARARYWADA